MNLLKSKIKLANIVGALLFTLTTPMVMAASTFDIKAKYDDINFVLVDLPQCGDVQQYLPALPTDPRADYYYQVVRKIFGQRDIPHYEQMFILGEKAAEMGHWKAKLFMAKLYLLRNTDGGYSNFDPAKARKYIDELMQQNVPQAFYIMEQNKINGIPNFANAPSPASVYLYQAAKLNDPTALADLYDVFRGVLKQKEADAALNCAVKQKDGNEALALLKMANVISDNAVTENDWKNAFHYLYRAAKAGSFEAMMTFPSKAALYKAQFSKQFVDKIFLDRMALVAQAMNPQYTYTIKVNGEEKTERGNGFLKFPHLETIVPLPPAPLPDWNGDVGVALDRNILKLDETTIDYDQLVKEAQ